MGMLPRNLRFDLPHSLERDEHRGVTLNNQSALPVVFLPPRLHRDPRGFAAGRGDRSLVDGLHSADQSIAFTSNTDDELFDLVESLAVGVTRELLRASLLERFEFLVEPGSLGDDLLPLNIEVGECLGARGRFRRLSVRIRAHGFSPFHCELMRRAARSRAFSPATYSRTANEIASSFGWR